MEERTIRWDFAVPKLCFKDHVRKSIDVAHAGAEPPMRFLSKQRLVTWLLFSESGESCCKRGLCMDKGYQ